MKIKVCKICRKSFEVSGASKYCSDACRQAGYKEKVMKSRMNNGYVPINPRQTSTKSYKEIRSAKNRQKVRTATLEEILNSTCSLKVWKDREGNRVECRGRCGGGGSSSNMWDVMSMAQ